VRPEGLDKLKKSNRLIEQNAHFKNIKTGYIEVCA
jgi:hypothetical protein